MLYDLYFINLLIFDDGFISCLQGYLQVASIYAGSDSVQLKGLAVVNELKHFLRLLTLCMLFSKKPFPVFLESAGYSDDDVLLQKPKAGVCYWVSSYLLLLVLLY